MRKAASRAIESGARFRRTRALAALALAAALGRCATAPPPSPPPEPVPAPAPAAPPETGPPETTWIVTAKSANVRERASTESGTVARLKKGDRLVGLEEDNGWLHVKLKDTRAGWIRKDLLKKDEACQADRRELLLMPPMLHMSESGASGTAGGKGRVVVEADVDDKGDVQAVRVVKNETGSAERAEMAKSEVKGVKFQPPVKKCKATGFTYVYTRTF
jgi:uncharacterized protein YgiM (DUF1202 family)